MDAEKCKMCNHFHECILLYDDEKLAVLSNQCWLNGYAPVLTMHFVKDSYHEIRKIMSKHGRKSYTYSGSKPFKEIERKFSRIIGKFRKAFFSEVEPENCDFPFEKLIEKWNK